MDRCLFPSHLFSSCLGVTKLFLFSLCLEVMKLFLFSLCLGVTKLFLFSFVCVVLLLGGSGEKETL